ncbi:hypothetical protein [Tepidibacter formicigenes]|jgi:hypothetical protein|uniref:STAS domain-containing protein n=1 Tax=Tepidibacter formicigenes DSM 15518 TaxID=1123349 RepID=A0A1M6QSP6_9FIRM|nr:hypothetical protein [Tepidibacter formicigenes]SHK23339.1 hypothetical protein SAMN02744037_01940 [Tepidibacter formicigenes DSM 15518]
MLKIKINEEENIFLIDIGGFITKDNIDRFLKEYKDSIKKIKPSKYKLIINPKEFKTDENNILKASFRKFLKTGFKKILIVDTLGLIDSIRLNKLEKKFFFSRVKIVNSIEEALES